MPEAEYAIFTTPPINSLPTEQIYDDPLSIAVKETWRYIFNEWSPNSNYEFDETKMDFEFYDERCHDVEHVVMEIYVPIIPKSI
nr:effector binding domain-containing protein [Lacrimispora sp.]